MQALDATKRVCEWAPVDGGGSVAAGARAVLCAGAVPGGGGRPPPGAGAARGRLVRHRLLTPPPFGPLLHHLADMSCILYIYLRMDTKETDGKTDS